MSLSHNFLAKHFVLVAFAISLATSASAQVLQTNPKRKAFQPSGMKALKVGSQQPGTSSKRSPLYGKQGATQLPGIDIGGYSAQPATSRDQSYSDDPTKITLPFCTVMFVDEIRVPALEAGAIKEVYVEEGQAIPEGKIVAKIDDELLQLEEELSRESYDKAYKIATDRVSILAAEKEYELNKEMADKTRNLAKKGSRSRTEVREAQFRAELAQLKIKKAKNDQIGAVGDAKREMVRLMMVKKRIARTTLKSFYNAYVVEVLKKKQEYVNAGDDVLRLGRMDRLWVQGNIEFSRLNEHEALNRPVTITYPLADGKKLTLEGKIDRVSLERQGSDQYAVKVMVQNRAAGNGWLIRPYAQATMVIHLDRDVIKSEPATKSANETGIAPLPGIKR